MTKLKRRPLRQRMTEADLSMLKVILKLRGANINNEEEIDKAIDEWDLKHPDSLPCLFLEAVGLELLRAKAGVKEGEIKQ